MKAYITVMGKDRVGIIAKVATTLADCKVNIEDINQTILQGTFTMVMAVGTDESSLTIEEINTELKKCGEELGVEIAIRHEDIFNAMHQI
ncbi:MAG: ACT domain-containing protein [Clostridia bacterium]|nr:ACT domain-containing protein [Clostridia bacterium]MBO7177900.1 ACT domain-containing protein [Clostridia bacterium]